MKMSRSSSNCSQCFAQIARKSPASAKLWMEMCQFERDYNMSCSMHECDELALLEFLGVVVTTDVRSVISVRLKGRDDDDGDFLYCGGKCDSEKM